MLKASQYFSENTNIKTTAIGETHQPKVCHKDSECLTGRISQHMKCNIFEIDKGEILMWKFSLYLLKIYLLHLAITPMKKALVVYHAKDYDHLALQRHELSLSL